MSERSSFVTEYVYCDDCFEKVKFILLCNDDYLVGRQIDKQPIIAGLVKSLGPGMEVETIQEKFDKYNAPCHFVRLAIIHDSGLSSILIISPDGWVDTIGQVSLKELEEAT